ncbi:basic leucine zipper transcriptional factor ATF-like 3 isoform X2 [Thalassophryne amazonica]|uniref:basic leucine zipper transcriptional factor ATF-like 3 isoform X2 n=1 Tax=Thalassophryne amazonica TaxID=390379 RepID=UPI001471B935|nr:basic leucine zipper transcriptional factor ATF-like 3 isoform X2 [Thalassophryne amazonica]
MSHGNSSSRQEPVGDRPEGSEDEGRRMRRREKNRAAAKKSRKRQTQRADQLHEVDSLSEEQRLLTEALSAHRPFCAIMHCSSSLKNTEDWSE